MQNTVIEHKALSLSGSVYFNSTTKYVKPISPPPITQNKPQSPPPTQSVFVNPNHQNQSSVHLSSLIFKSSPPTTNTKLQRTLNKKSPEKEQRGEMGAAQLAAINLSANIFMNATTRFVKGFNDLSPVNQNRSKTPHKKSRSQGKQKEISPKKTVDPEASPTSVKRQRTPQKNAMDMAAANYMTSTTKYVKTTTESNIVDAAKGKIQKIVRNRPQNTKLQRILSKDKVNPNESPAKSGSSSGSKVQRRRDRTRELKFLERKPQDAANVKESAVTVKERASSIDFDFQNRRNDTKIQLNTKPQPTKPVSLINNYKTNDSKSQIPPQTPSSTFKQQVRPPLSRIQRATIAETKSADKKIEVKEQTTRPFARQQQTRPQLIKHVQTVKSATSLPSGQLPLQTPIKAKLQSLKVINKEESKPIAKTQQNIQISTIKEERSSAIQNTKTTISNKRSINIPKEDSSTHVQENAVQSANYKAQQNSRMTRQQSSKIIKKEENTEASQNNYAAIKINSQKNVKPAEKVQEPTQPSRPIIKRQQVQPAKQSIIQTRKTTTPSLLQEKKPLIKSEKAIQSKGSQKLMQNRGSIKTEHSQKGSKTSIDQKVIDNSVKKAPIVVQSKVVQPVKQATLDKVTNKDSTLKKSFALTQVLHKFYIRQISKAFESILNQSKSLKIHSKQASILAFAAVNTLNIYQKSIKLRFFQQIKRLPSLKQQNKRQINVNIQRQSAAIFIFRVLMSKHRDYFELLKRNRNFSINHNIQNNPKNQVKKPQSKNKAYTLQQLIRIVQSFSKNSMQKSYNKILLFSASNLKKPIQKEQISQQTRSPSKYTKPPRDYQAEKQSHLQARNQLQSIVSSIQSRMADKKRYVDLQKSKLIKRQQDLTNKIKTAEAQVFQKRKLNKQRKNQLQALGQRQDLDISLPEYEPLIGLLTEIYSAIFSNNDEKINKQALVKKYQLNKEDHNSLLDQWSVLIQNARLKSQISKWQGGDPFGPSQGAKREGEVLSSAMRNLIRERYLWEWVKLTAQRM